MLTFSNFRCSFGKYSEFFWFSDFYLGKLRKIQPNFSNIHFIFFIFILENSKKNIIFQIFIFHFFKILRIFNFDELVLEEKKCFFVFFIFQLGLSQYFHFRYSLGPADHCVCSCAFTMALKRRGGTARELWGQLCCKWKLLRGPIILVFAFKWGQ